MTTSTQATDVLQTLEGHALLATQITFNGEGFGGTAQFLHIAILEILDARVGVDTGFGEDGFGPCGTNSVDIGEGCLLYTSDAADEE